MTRASLIPFFLLLATLGLAEGQEPPLGPTVGHVAPDEATLWLHAPAAKRVVELKLNGVARTVPFERLGRGFGVLRVSGLTPETSYKVKASVPGAGEFDLRFATPPLPRAWGKVRFGVGSCMRFPKQPVWKVVAKEAPEFFVWLGDTVYYKRHPGGGADWDSVDSMLKRQLAGRRVPGLLQVMRSMPCYSVWDDHDYGPNDSNRSFALRAESRLVHRYLWAANPGFGQDEQGVYFNFRRGPLEFFLLDGRSFKSTIRGIPRPQREVYGKRQLDWLKKGLLRSNAPLKVIGSGVQALFGYAPAEGWFEARTEREAFMTWLKAHDVGPVLFLSGDIHVSELYQKELAPGRNLWELTSSGLAADAFGFQAFFEKANRPERRWVVTKPNVCFVEIDIPRDPKRLAESTLRFVSKSAADGKILAETKTTFASFGSKKANKAPAPGAPGGRKQLGADDVNPPHAALLGGFAPKLGRGDGLAACSRIGVQPSLGGSA
ncbi:MAG: alkaline phosphatase family protein, partial [Planctomycetes bacterium]|nr:alkaline phosphatase family protein [Planctomycetota bacterium]